MRSQPFAASMSEKNGGHGALPFQDGFAAPAKWFRDTIPPVASDFSVSIECNPDPAFSAPDDAARPAEAIGLNNQGELVGNEEWCDDLKSGAGLRNVTDGAVNYTAAETDRSRLKHAAPRCCSVLVSHCLKLRARSESSTRGNQSGARSSAWSRSRTGLVFQPDTGHIDRAVRAGHQTDQPMIIAMSDQFGKMHVISAKS